MRTLKKIHDGINLLAGLPRHEQDWVTGKLRASASHQNANVASKVLSSLKPIKKPVSVLLSHNSKDKPFVRAVYRYLSTARTGTCFATRSDSFTATQTGNFTETTPANQPVSNFAPASIAGKTITVGIIGASGTDGLFADYGALRTTFSSSGNRATSVPITANLNPDTATYTYTKTSGVSATVVLTYAATADFPTCQEVYQVSFISAIAGTYIVSIPGTNEKATGNFILE